MIVGGLYHDMIFLLCRAFLASFQLPGEAQKIDRMMECFALRYCNCNPGTFSNQGNSRYICTYL